MLRATRGGRGRRSNEGGAWAAADNVGVARVEFYRGATLLGSVTSSRYSLNWDTTTVGNGAYQLSAKAYDAAGNSATSASRTVTVSNAPPADTTPPTVTLTAPAAGATVSGVVTLAASASDDVGGDHVDFLVDGQRVATVTAGPS